MKSWLLWIFWAVVALIGAIIVELVSNQVEASLPSISSRIVRRQAKKMGALAERCEEEWLAHLDETPGGLAKLLVAMGVLFMPLRRRIETWHDEPGGVKRVAITWMQDHAGWLIVPVLALLLVVYPPDQARSAAYAVLLPFLLFSALCLTPAFRRAVTGGYERLNYLGRVGTGGLTVPLVLYYLLVWSFVDPSRQAPENTVRDFHATEPTIVIVSTLSTEIDRHEPSVASEGPYELRTTPVSPLSGGPAQGPLLGDDGAEGDLKLVTLPSRRHEGRFLVFSDTPSIPLPEQPIPSMQEFIPGPPPATPTNLRIFAAVE